MQIHPPIPVNAFNHSQANKLGETFFEYSCGRPSDNLVADSVGGWCQLRWQSGPVEETWTTFVWPRDVHSIFINLVRNQSINYKLLCTQSTMFQPEGLPQVGMCIQLIRIWDRVYIINRLAVILCHNDVMQVHFLHVHWSLVDENRFRGCQL